MYSEKITDQELCRRINEARALLRQAQHVLITTADEVGKCALRLELWGTADSIGAKLDILRELYGDIFIADRVSADIDAEETS